MNRCILPLLADSDDSMDAEAEELADSSQPEMEDESSSSAAEDSLLENRIQQPAEEVADRRIGVRLADTLSDGEEEENGAKNKREKIDSGVGDLCESERTPSSTDHSPASTSTSSTSVANPSTVSVFSNYYFLIQISFASISFSDVQHESPHHRPHLDSERSAAGAEIGNVGTARPLDGEGILNVLSGVRFFTHSIAGERERTALIFFERSSEELETSTDSSEENGTGCDRSQQDESTDMMAPTEDYSFYIKRSLMELPLPLPLKLFLNYGRPF